MKQIKQKNLFDKVIPFLFVGLFFALFFINIGIYNWEGGNYLIYSCYFILGYVGLYLGIDELIMFIQIKNKKMVRIEL